MDLLTPFHADDQLPTGKRGIDAERVVRADLHDQLNALVLDLIRHRIDLQFAKKELESAYIKEILKANGGNIGQSAKALGIHRNTLSKRIKELNISPTASRS